MRFKLFALFILPVLAHALPGFYEPWGKDADLSYVPKGTIEVQNPSHSLAVRMAEHIIRFHQNVLSPVDGPRSHFRPSSSSYMMQSMQKHGFIEGFLMGCDRLMRENSDAWVYRKIEENGQLFKYDPPRSPKKNSN
jgi:putative component of membrane protein insertase Oxa1/YidC/SpoIIIJ protein YidD